MTKGSVNMNNLILFINSFLSYLALLAVIVVLAGIAVFIGIKMRRKKNLQLAAEAAATESADK